jgi:MoaA/NifB/PqqE/SkfB family radical SAM enzyme
MCGFGRKHNSTDKFMSFEDFKEIYNQLGSKANKIRLNGRGESTIHPQFKKILRYIGISNKISLFTNGNYIDEEINQLFVELDVELYFSMDSSKPKMLEEIRKGVDYKRLNDNISSMKDKETRPFIIFTLQEKNINEIIPIAEYAISKECHLILNVLRRDEGIEVFRKIVNNKKKKIIEDFSYIKKIFKESNLELYLPNQISGIEVGSVDTSVTCGSMEICPNIENELCILYNGDVTPCNMFNPFVYGNIKNNRIEDIVNGEKKHWFKQNHKKYYYCKNCACLVR